MLSKEESPLIEGDGRVDGDCIGEGGVDEEGMDEGGMDEGGIDEGGVDEGQVLGPYI